ncbi:MAG: ATP-binding protein [Sulfitobacter sp.]
MTDGPLTALLNALPLPTLAIDQGERIAAANKAAQTILGQGIEGRHFITVLRQPAVAEAVEQSLKDDTSRVVPYLTGDGDTEVTYDVHVQRVVGRRLVMVSLQDVTQLTQAGQMRRDFVANVSHELRTPLTSLMGFIETLKGPARDDVAARDRFLGIMGSEAERMNRLVGDLLSLSRVESQGRLRPTQRINLAGVITTTMRNLSALADEAKVVLNLDLGTSPIHVLGDSDQLQQVFTNLIENAIKYGGKNGVVDIAAQIVDHDPALRAPAVRIVVADHGPGIDPQHLPRLTERFYRADSHRSRALGGTGLGLAIVKHILNRHRGRLKVTSELGNGAQFTVSIPLDLVG